MDCTSTENFSFLFSKFEAAWFLQCCERHSCFLINFCLHKLLDSSKVHSSRSHDIHDIANGVVRITTLLRERNFLVSDETQSKLLEFVFQFIDFVLDVVRHSCVNIFENLIELHLLKCEHCSILTEFECPWIKNIYSSLSDFKLVTAFRLKALLSLIRCSSYARSMLTDEFFGVLYNRIDDASLSNGISSMISEDLGVVETRKRSHIRWIKQCLIHESPLVRAAAKQRILLNILKIPQTRTWFLENLHYFMDLDECSTFALEANLTLAKFAILHQKSLSMAQGWQDFLSAKSMLIGLLSENTNIKLNAWQLLCDHPKRSRPFSASELDLAGSFILCNMCEQSPSSRQKFFSSLGKLLERLRDSLLRLTKNLKEHGALVRAYGEFLNTTYRLALRSLSPDANFNRRISALTLLKFLFCGRYLASSNIDLIKYFGAELRLEETFFTALLSTLDDDFQLCQELALEILCDPHVPENSFNDVNCFQQLRMEMSFSASLDDARRSFRSNYRLQLFCRRFPDETHRLLDALLLECEMALRHLEDAPIRRIADVDDFAQPYRLLANVEHVLRAAFFTMAHDERTAICQLVLGRLVPMCYKFAEHVAPVCHSMSPEGFLPPELIEETLESNELESSKRSLLFAQKLLVSCWRTHKAVSSLFGLITTKLPFPDGLTADSLRQIGDYLWLQLTECRHCGAFESSALAFEAFCRRLWALDNMRPDFSTHVSDELLSPTVWLEKAIDALTGKHDVDNLCSTRRSAGLPYLVSVILTTEKLGKRFPHLNETIERLLDCRGFEPKFEIHCVNVLKALFSNSALAEGVVTHVERAFCVCFDGCAASEWSTRNAYCQLFAALVQRVFGVPKCAQRSLHVHPAAKMTSFSFFSRYPSLYAYLQKTLTNSARRRVGKEFEVFPALILFAHLQPSTVAMERHYPLVAFLPPIAAQLFGSLLHALRELAAAALLAVASPLELATILDFALSEIQRGLKKIGENFVDAVLLLVMSFKETGFLKDATIESKCASIMNVMVSLSSELCDWNRFTVLSLVEQIGSAALQRSTIVKFSAALDAGDVNFERWRCSARPFGALIARNHTTEWARIAPDNTTNNFKGLLRCEAYRAICLEEKEIDVDSNAGLWLIESALSDFCACDDEGHMEWIVELLTRDVGRLEVALRKRTADFSIKMVAFRERICRKSSTLLKLRKFAVIIASIFHLKAEEFASTGFVDFIGEALADSDDQLRYSALKAVDELFRYSNANAFEKLLLEKCCVALKDESAEIRAYASSIFSQRLLPELIVTSVHSSGSLNSELCWSAAMAAFPALRGVATANAKINSQGEDDDESGNALFDACPQNTFMERLTVIDFDVFMAYVKGVMSTREENGVDDDEEQKCTPRM